MADNVIITAGTGVTIHADEYTHGTLGSGKTQLVKLVDGVLDSDTPITVNVGAKANALRVAPANDITDGTYIGDIKFGEALYTEDVATPATIVGFATMIERDDALGGLTPTEGDWTSLRCDANGALWVHDNVVNTLLGTIDADTSNIATSLGNLDNAVDGNFLNVNLNFAGADAQIGEGAISASTLRVTIATDDDGIAHLATIAGDTTNIETAVQLIDNAVYVDDAAWTGDTSSHFLTGGIYQSTPQSITDGKTGPLQVDVNGCLILGTSAKAIGKLAANTGVDIGDVDITSIIPLTGATNLGKARDVACGANDVGVMALAVRDDTLTTLTPADGDYAPLRVGSTGKLHVTDANITACNTGAVVISSGTVTTVSTVTTLSQLGGQAISMGEGVVAAGCQRVTLATDDDGVAHLATIANDTTAIETAIEIIDDWDATHASAAVADGPQVMGAAYNTALPTDVGADADAARLVTDRYGRLCTGLQPQAAKAILDNADTTTAREIVAATASRKIYVTSLILSVDTAGNYWLEDGDATQVTGKFYLAANGGVAITFPEGTPLNTVTVNKALNVKGSTAGNVSVTVTYYLAV